MDSSKLEQYDAFLVDRDGTIVSTCTSNYLAYQSALEDFGISVNFDFFSEFHAGRSWPMIASKHFPDLDATTISAISKAKALRFVDYISSLSWNIDLIHFLENKRWYLISNGSIESSIQIFNSYPGQNGPLVVVAPNSLNMPKPSPDMYLETIKKYSLNINNSLAIEDSDDGVISAETAGLTVLRIPHFCIN